MPMLQPNHGNRRRASDNRPLFLILIYIKTQLCKLRLPAWLFLMPSLHQATTDCGHYDGVFSLFLIPFLHPTTTFQMRMKMDVGCSSFHFYIKPQLCPVGLRQRRSCFSFYFIQKPQRYALPCVCSPVVSHSNSTSNHNVTDQRMKDADVVFHPISTSNHNTILMRPSDQ